MKQDNWFKRNEKLLPWAAGAGFAVSHIVIASNCTVPKEGRCSTCGGCVVALTAIVGWAIYKRKKGNGIYDEPSPQPVLNADVTSQRPHGGSEVS